MFPAKIPIISKAPTAKTLATAPAITNGYSLAFDGTSDTLKIDSDASIDNFLSGGGSLSVWYTMEGGGYNNYGKLITKDGSSDGFQILHAGGTSKKFQYAFHNTNTTYTAGVNNKVHSSYGTDWHNIVLTYDIDDVATTHPIIYIDGSLEASTAATHATDGLGIGTYDDSGKDVYVGDSVSVDRGWNGKADEISFWNRILSSDEAESLYNSGTPTDLEGIEGLVGWWRMEENTGSTVADSSENSNTGAISNATFSDDAA